MNKFYKKMPKPVLKDNTHNIKEEDGDGEFRYFDRTEHMWFRKPGRVFCKDCHHSQDLMSEHCTNCSSTNLISLSEKARVPRKTASKRKWKEFFRLFVDS